MAKTEPFYAAHQVPTRPATFRHDPRLVEYQPLVRKYALRALPKCWGLVDLDDLVAMGTIALWSAIESYKPELGAFGPYVTRCVRHSMGACVTAARRRRRIPTWATNSLDDDNDPTAHLLADRAPLPEHVVSLAETVRPVLKRVETLSSRERAIIRLRYLKDDQTLRELGEGFGVSHERARQLETIALKKLRAVAARRVA
ncbi:MAG TPA: sigma-70 family RNA polymerase sigma factor [Polyangiaceae bacterium]